MSPLASVLVPYVGLHAANALVLKYLAIRGFLPADTLVFRGAGCLLVAVAWSLRTRRSLWPVEPRSQLVRLVVAGLSLFLLTASYRFANAATVSVIQRMDIALLILLGALVGEPASWRQKGLATGVLFLFFLCALWFQGPTEGLMGYGLAFAGTCGVTAGFLLMKTSSRKENEGTIAAVAAVAILLYGLGGRFLPGAEGVDTLGSRGWALASGAMMFGIYVYTIRLYRVMAVAKAEYPTLFAVLLVLPLEHWLFGIPVQPAYVVFVAGSVLLLGLILVSPSPQRT